VAVVGDVVGSCGGVHGLCGCEVAGVGYVVGVWSGVHVLCGRGLACVGYMVGSSGWVALPVQNLMFVCCGWVAVEGSLVGVCIVLRQCCLRGGRWCGLEFCLWWASAGFCLSRFGGVSS
jgi:hypothetical protein